MKNRLFTLLLALVLCISSLPALALTPDDLVATIGDFSQYGDGDMTPYETPVSVSLGMSINLSRAFPDGDGYENNVWSRYFHDNLNIDLELAFTTSDLNDKVNTMIATGDLPDVLQVTANQLALLARSDLIRDDIYEVYQQYAGEGIRRLVEGFDSEAVIASCTFDGKMMALPELNASPGEKAPVIWLRKDWLDKLNLNKPSNYADLRNIMEAFTFNDPDGNNKNDTVGLVFCKSLGNQHMRLDGFFNIFGAYVSQGFWVKDPQDSSKAVYGAFQPEVKTALSELNSLYNEGILDKDFAVYDESAAKALVCSGKCGVVFANAYSPNTFLYACIENDPQADWIAVAIPGVEESTTKVGVTLPIRNYLVFSKEFEHPEAVFKMINTYYKVAYSPDTTAETYAKYVSTSGGNSSYNSFSIYPWGYFQPVFQNERSCLYINSGIKSDDPAMPAFARSFALGVEDYMAGDTSMWRWYRFFGPEAGHTITSQYIAEGLYTYNAWYGPNTETMAENMSLIYDLAYEMIYKMIIGQESLDSFDDYKAKAATLCLDDITNEVNDWLAQNAQ